MTKTLNTHLSEHAAPAPRAAKRPRTWLVALLGFGAADLLVLNLWAVPNLITGTTTTDMRAAQRGDMQAASIEAVAQPEAVAVVQQQAEPTPNAEPAAVQAAEDPQPAAQPPEPTEQAVAAHEEPVHEEPVHEEPVHEEPVHEKPAHEVSAHEVSAHEVTAHEVSAHAEPAHEAALPEPAAAPEPQVHAAPRAEAPPGGAPSASAEVDVPADPAVAKAFAIRAAKRAVRVALQDRAAVSGNGPFDALSDDDQPLTQIFFSLGNFTLGPNGKQTLERTLAQLTGDERAILIVGAADPSGTEQVNAKLSDARAQSVAEWLLAHGVDAQRIQTRAIGHEGAVGSTLDRRVDIWLGGSR